VYSKQDLHRLQAGLSGDIMNTITYHIVLPPPFCIYYSRFVDIAMHPIYNKLIISVLTCWNPERSILAVWTDGEPIHRGRKEGRKDHLKELICSN
jgi:hypothetical protein